MTEKSFKCAVDTLGRVVIPAPFRTAIGLDVVDPVNRMVCIELEAGKLMVRKFSDSCIFCGCEDNLKKIHHSHVCNECLKLGSSET